MSALHSCTRTTERSIALWPKWGAEDVTSHTYQLYLISEMFSLSAESSALWNQNPHCQGSQCCSDEKSLKLLMKLITSADREQERKQACPGTGHSNHKQGAQVHHSSLTHISFTHLKPKLHFSYLWNSSFDAFSFLLSTDQYFQQWLMRTCLTWHQLKLVWGVLI